MIYRYLVYNKQPQNAIFEVNYTVHTCIICIAYIYYISDYLIYKSQQYDKLKKYNRVYIIGIYICSHLQLS